MASTGFEDTGGSMSRPFFLCRITFRASASALTGTAYGSRLKADD